MLCCCVPILPFYLWRKGKLSAPIATAIAVVWVVLGVVAVVLTPLEGEDPTDPAPLVQTPSESSSPSPSTSPADDEKPKATTSARPTRSPTPTPTPTPTPKPKPKPKPTPELDPNYGTCADANDHGLGPYRRGVDPEYHYYDDRDGDGIVCEWN